MNYADEFIESAGQVAKMLYVINQITGKITPVVIDAGDVKIALTAQPIVDAPKEEPVEEPVAEEEVPSVEAPAA